MTRILWLSRHKPEEEQIKELREKLGYIEIIQKSVTVSSIDEIKQLMEEVQAQEMVVVLPPNLLAELTNPKHGLPKPIRAVMNRIVHENGEVEFKHSHFERVERVEIITKPL
jgi:hypothetical protein